MCSSKRSDRGTRDTSSSGGTLTYISRLFSNSTVSSARKWFRKTERLTSSTTSTVQQPCPCRFARSPASNLHSVAAVGSPVRPESPFAGDPLQSCSQPMCPSTPGLQTTELDLAIAALLKLWIKIQTSSRSMGHTMTMVTIQPDLEPAVPGIGP
jgi:hypothetical protein